VAGYARQLRPLLPPEAFHGSRERLTLLLINGLILLLGWRMAGGLHRWPWPAPLLFLPLALVMGNAVIVLGFASHDLLHGNAVGRGWLRRALALLPFGMLWMPPTLWLAAHNREHHGHTNALSDPDRTYLETQPSSWGKRIHHLFIPSCEVGPGWLAVGMAGTWFAHTLLTLASVLLRPDGSGRFVPAAFVVSAPERRAIAAELALIVALHAAVLWWLGLHPLNLLLGYVLPLALGYAGVMAYIYTNHLLCPLGESNDPLRNSLSLSVPPWLDLLHLNFSHHTEHHIFPGLNSSYYPQLRLLLQQHHAERYQLLPAAEAWRLLLSTPRFYRDATTLTTWNGAQAMPVPALGPLRAADSAPAPCA
jgi:fatty acid desaturase